MRATAAAALDFAACKGVDRIQTLEKKIALLNSTADVVGKASSNLSLYLSSPHWPRPLLTGLALSCLSGQQSVDALSPAAPRSNRLECALSGSRHQTLGKSGSATVPTSGGSVRQESDCKHLPPFLSDA